jgi:hypothetical protein
VEPQRVTIGNWPQDLGAGGWVYPYGHPFAHWVVTAVHARYLAPRLLVEEYDPVLGEVVRRVKRFVPLSAYLVDLDGSGDRLASFERVLLHQVPPVGWWYLKDPEEEHLQRMQEYKVSDT